MQAPETGKTLNNLGLAFSNALGQTLSDVCEQTWKTKVSDGPPSSVQDFETEAQFKFILAGSLEGEMLLAIRSEDLAALRFKASSGSEISPEAAATLLGSALQGASGVFAQWLLQYGVVNVHVEAASEPNLPGGQCIELLGYANDAEKAVSFSVFFSPRLIAAAQTASAKSFAYPLAVGSANLDLVLDVELNITLRFGQRQLSLREVLDLTSGSVVELDRQVDEPIELVLDGRVVARGEAVIIDGNYGMRITQVVQPVVA